VCAANSGHLERKGGLRKRDLVLIGLVLALAGCGWIEEKRQEARRNQADTDFVEAVGSGDMVTVRSVLAEDSTFVNAVRWVPGRRKSLRADSALTMALRKGRRDMVELLLAHGANPNQVDFTGASPLGAAVYAENDRPAFVALLLEKGANPDLAYGGTTALHTAAGSASPETADALRLLLAKASGVAVRDARGQTPLHSAARSANVAGLRMLVAKGADPNVLTLAPQSQAAVTDDVAGTTPLAIVATDRQIAAAATLCAAGADPDVKDSTGASAREVAARVATKEAAGPNPTRSDVVRHQNMAAFLARGGGCDALRARERRGEKIADLEVDRIANESECAAGWGWACGQAGWAFDSGEGAKQDEARALVLFRRGCETASEWCCGMVGIYHVEGTTVPEDRVEGARWLLKGCEPSDPKRSDAQSCSRLGALYAQGTGVPRDLGRARALFRKACDGHYEKACANLAKYAGG
jgi:ankyrin repeat protein